MAWPQRRYGNTPTPAPNPEHHSPTALPAPRTRRPWPGATVVEGVEQFDDPVGGECLDPVVVRVVRLEPDGDLGDLVTGQDHWEDLGGPGAAALPDLVHQQRVLDLDAGMGAVVVL